jgi:hypothetical protein
VFPTQADDEQQRMIAWLKTSPEFAALGEWSRQQRDGYLAKLAEALWRRPDDVTQAALREKAAFFRGMNIVLNQPFFSAKALERALEQPTEEL